MYMYDICVDRTDAKNQYTQHYSQLLSYYIQPILTAEGDWNK